MRSGLLYLFFKESMSPNSSNSHFQWKGVIVELEKHFFVNYLLKYTFYDFLKRIILVELSILFLPLYLFFFFT